MELFVSYVAEDTRFARIVKKHLNELGYETFLTTDDIGPLQSWRDEILQHINSSSALIAIVTPRTTKSAWMNQEIGIAMAKGKPIISLRFGNARLSGYLESIQSIATSEKNVKAGVDKAIDAIDRISRKDEGRPIRGVEPSYSEETSSESGAVSKLVVYFDDDYPNSYIGYDEGRKLSGNLVSKGFSVLTAAQLEIWIRDVLLRRTAHQTSLVFAMDIIPEQIFGDVDANVPFRKYLDAGGRVTWIGDIPGWYKGKSHRRREEVWQYGSTISLFGIIPIIARSVRPVQLTSIGEKAGLASRWYSARPIAAYRGFRSATAKSALSREPVLVLAWSKVTHGEYVFNPPKRMNWLRRLQISVPGFVSADISLQTEDKEIRNATCASAWHMAFNLGYPEQGFFRIWDYPIRMDELNEDRLHEVYNVATTTLR